MKKFVVFSCMLLTCVIAEYVPLKQEFYAIDQLFQQNKLDDLKYLQERYVTEQLILKDQMKVLEGPISGSVDPALLPKESFQLVLIKSRIDELSQLVEYINGLLGTEELEKQTFMRRKVPQTVPQKRWYTPALHLYEAVRRK